MLRIIPLKWYEHLFTSTLLWISYCQCSIGFRDNSFTKMMGRAWFTVNGMRSVEVFILNSAETLIVLALASIVLLGKISQNQSIYEGAKGRPSLCGLLYLICNTQHCRVKASVGLVFVNFVHRGPDTCHTFRAQSPIHVLLPVTFEIHFFVTNISGWYY